MQKRDRNEWKKIVTAVKEVLGIKYRTRDIYDTKALQRTIKEMAFIFARENKEQDPVAMSEEQYFKAQISFLRNERDKYKKMYEETVNTNNRLVDIYEREKKKTWRWFR